MDLTKRWSELRKPSRAGWPNFDATLVSLPQHPAVASLFLVRSMPRVFVLGTIVAMSLSCVAYAQRNERTLMHTFQEGSRIVYVTIVDRPPAPVGLVSSEDPSRKERWFMISRPQFDKMWSKLLSARVEKYARYAGDKQPERRFDALNYCVFSAAEMPQGWKKNYAVPNSKAPPALLALATQFRS